jgi:tetratricopeptide (TPR) repeat protein
MTEPTLLNSRQDEGDLRAGPGLTRLLSHSVVLGCLLAIITIIVFWPVVRAEFVEYDDPEYVTSNPHVLSGLTASGVGWAFRTGHAGNWHPLTWLSHMMDVRLFGKGPSGPHLVNLLFHAANGALLFLLLHRLTGSRWRSLLVAALFALHPLHVESVAWISERKDVLSTFFGLLSLWSYGEYVLHASRTSSPRGGASRYYVVSLLLFALGLLSKPMLVSWPFVLLLLDYWPLRRFSLAPRTSGKQTPQSSPLPFGREEGEQYGRGCGQDAPALPLRTGKQLLIEKIPFFLLTVASSLATFIAQKAGGAVQSLGSISITSRIENALVSYVRYMGKTFYPINLAAPYPYPSHWPAMEVFISVLVLVVLCFGALWFGRRYPFLPVGWLWFLGSLVPVIGLIQVGEQSMADRYTYVPLIGLFVIFTWGIAEIFKRWQVPRFGSLLAAGLVLVPCTVLTRHQLQYWQNTESLFRHATLVTKNNWLAFSNLGSYYDGLGRTDEALANYRKAVELQPNFGDALNNIGCLLAGRKQYSEAILVFESALRATPDLIEAHNNLGRALKDVGRTDEAIAHFQMVLKRKPDHIDALNNLGNALLSKSQFAEANRYFQASLRVKPGQSTIEYNLANSLARLKRTDEAILHYRLALQQRPDYAEARHDLGIALAMQGKLDAAIAEFRQAVKNRPEDPTMHFSLGKALAGGGKMEEAIIEFQTSLRYGPDNPLTHFSLGKALASQKKMDEAAGHFAEALRLKPDFAPAKQALQTLEQPTK